MKIDKNVLIFDIQRNKFSFTCGVFSVVLLIISAYSCFNLKDLILTYNSSLVSMLCYVIMSLTYKEKK